MAVSFQTKSVKQRIALVIQYLGTNFSGWQRQPNRITIQSELERAIASVVGHSVTVHGAGRTDSGVHAAAQVAHFDYAGPIPASKWSKILNARLPEGILIRASASVVSDWHARFSASWRRYRYTIYTDKLPNLFVSNFSWHYYRAKIHESTIQAALNPLIGHHDLAAFRRAGSSRKHSWVEIQAAECYRNDPFVCIEIQADGFLYGMVRLLVGMLIEVGTETRSLSNFTQLWREGRRDLVKYSAPARGLCLLRVGYQDFPFPKQVWFDTQPTLILT